MPRYDIERWEQEQAELNIRHWLTAIGQWEPEVAYRRLQQQEATAAALGEMTPIQIEELLHTEAVGRIGCHAEGQTYVVPTTYVYDNGCIYGHMGPGMRLRMLRANPDVCFEVDQVENLAHWRSVIAWGRFEELHGDEAERALQLLITHIKPRLAGTPIHESARPPEPDPQHKAHHQHEPQSAVVYRITLTAQTGRFELH